MTDVFCTLPSFVELSTSRDDRMALFLFLRGSSGVWWTAAALEDMLCWKRQKTGERVRKVIKELQLLGVPIVQSHRGFTYTCDVVLLESSLVDLRARQAGLQRTVLSLERTRDRLLVGQDLLLEGVL